MTLAPMPFLSVPRNSFTVVLFDWSLLAMLAKVALVSRSLNSYHFMQISLVWRWAPGISMRHGLVIVRMKHYQQSLFLDELEPHQVEVNLWHRFGGSLSSSKVDIGFLSDCLGRVVFTLVPVDWPPQTQCNQASSRHHFRHTHTQHLHTRTDSFTEDDWAT